MFPLKDENPTRRVPVFTVAFIVLCTLIFFMQFSAGAAGMQRIVVQYGLIPGALLGTEPAAAGYAAVPPPLTVITSMFLHGGWMHLIGNMLFLWIFGNNIEDELGHGRFILFYLLSGIGAAAAQIIAMPYSNIPMVGASGAISGVLGAYLVLYPRAKILTLIFLGVFITWAHIRAVWFIGGWFLFQTISALAASGGAGGVAWWAHIGGFLAGLLLIFVFRSRRATIRPPRRGPWG